MSDSAPDVVAPWLETEIAKAVAPYVGKVSDEELAWMKEQLRASVTSGAAKQFARGAAPHAVVASGAITAGTPRAPSGHDDVATVPSKEPKRGAGGT